MFHLIFAHEANGVAIQFQDLYCREALGGVEIEIPQCTIMVI